MDYTAKYNQPKLYIPPSCWFSRQAIDQYSPLLYNTYWGFFRPNVIDRPLSLDYGISGQLNHYFNYYLSETFIVLLKRKFLSFIYYNLIKNFCKNILINYKVFINLTLRQPKHYILTCTPLLMKLIILLIKIDVRLACVKHLDSVHSEPSSNSIYWYSRFASKFY